jgi:hypothetical protein
MLRADLLSDVFESAGVFRKIHIDDEP